MIKETLVYDEGIIAMEVKMRMLQRDTLVVTVPVHFENHGFVLTTFFGKFAEELMNETHHLNTHGKGSRFFFSGNVCYDTYQKDGKDAVRKSMTVQDFC